MRHAWTPPGKSKESQRCLRCGMERRREGMVVHGVNPMRARWVVWLYSPDGGNWFWKRQRLAVPKCKGSTPAQRELELRRSDVS